MHFNNHPSTANIVHANNPLLRQLLLHKWLMANNGINAFVKRGVENVRYWRWKGGSLGFTLGLTRSESTPASETIAIPFNQQKVSQMRGYITQSLLFTRTLLGKEGGKGFHKIPPKRDFTSKSNGNIKKALEEREGEMLIRNLKNNPENPRLYDIESLKKRYYVLPKLSFLMNRFQPWTMDSFFAMFSWVLIGNVIFVLIGTTTFVSLVVWVANTLQFQEYLALKVGEFFTKETGVTVSFESAIVPNWKDRRLIFNKVKFYKDPNASNPTRFDMSVELIEVKLSLWKLWEGKGLIQECKIEGLRGVVDYRDFPSDFVVQRRTVQPSDFEISNFKVEDALVTFRYSNFRPFTVSILNFDANLFRQQWIFYDILNANSIVGVYDNCLFTLHPRLSDQKNSEKNQDPNIKTVHGKISGIPIDQFNGSGTDKDTGALGWLVSGTVDVDANILIPIHHNSNPAIDRSLKDELLVLFKNIWPHSQQPVIQDKDEKVTFKFNFRFNNLRADMPLQPRDWSVLDQALVRPVVAYVNANSTKLLMNCEVQLSTNDFNGSSSIYDSGLVEAVSNRMAIQWAALVKLKKERSKQVKKVATWVIKSLSEDLVHIWKHFKGMETFFTLINT